MVLVPDAARRADGQGGLVDGSHRRGVVLSIGDRGPVGRLSGLPLDLASVHLFDGSVRFVSCSLSLHCPRLILIDLLVNPGRYGRYLDSLRLGPIGLLFLVRS